VDFTDSKYYYFTFDVLDQKVDDEVKVSERITKVKNEENVKIRVPFENATSMILRFCVWKWFLKIFDSQKVEEKIYLSPLKKKKQFVKYIEVGSDRKVVLRISLEEDKGDEPEEGDDVQSNEVEFLRILNVPQPFKYSASSPLKSKTFAEPPKTA